MREKCSKLQIAPKRKVRENNQVIQHRENAIHVEPNLSRLLQAKQWLFLIYTNDVNSVSFWIGSLTWSFNFFQATDCLKQNAPEENSHASLLQLKDY